MFFDLTIGKFSLIRATQSFIYSKTVGAIDPVSVKKRVSLSSPFEQVLRSQKTSSFS
jgi:hypothetical protein